MKKFVFVALLLLLGFGCLLPQSLLASPAQDFADPYVPVVIRQPDGSLVKTPYTGFVSKHEALVPLAVVTDYLKKNNGMTLSAGRSGLSISLERSAFELETPELTLSCRRESNFS